MPREPPGLRHGRIALELGRRLADRGDRLHPGKRAPPPPGGQFDLVFDAVGKPKTSAFKVACAAVGALTPGGKYTSVDDRFPQLTAALLAQLTAWAVAGKLEPVIDRRYPLSQIAEAHRYVDQRHKKGNVIITIPH